MKKFIAFIAFAVFTATVGFGQMLLPKNVPAPVKKSFTKMYPAVKDITWEKATPYYVVSFKKDNIDAVAAYDKTGKWIETSSAFLVRDLPKAIKEKLNSQFEDAAITDAVLLETNGAKFYKVKMKKRDRAEEVLLTPQADIAVYNSPVKYKGK